LSADVHELEEQVKRLVSSMNEQARYIETIKDELRRQRELVEHEEFLRRKLQEEHEMLDEDLEDVRRRLREKDKKLTAAEEQVKQLKKQLGSQDRRVSHVQNSRRSSAAGSAAGNGGERMRAQLDQLMTKYSSLSEEHKKVVQERDELQITLKEVQAKLNEVKSDQLDVSQSETKHSSPNPPSNPPSNPSFNPPTNPPQNPPSNPSTNPPTHPSSDPQSDGGKMGERGKAKDRSISHGTSPKAAKKEQNTSKIRELEGLVQVLKEDRGRVESQAVEKERLLSVARQEAQNARQELELSANQNHHLQRLNKVLEEKVKSLERALAENGKPVPPSFEFQSPSSEFKTPTPNTAVSEVPTPPTPRLTDPQTGGPPQAVSPVEEGGDSRTSSVRLVAEMLEKLNTNSNGLEDVESSSLKIIKEEMNTMCANIQAFMDYSTDLIGREAVAVEDATESLQKKLREAGTGDATPPPRPSSSDSSDAKHGELNTSNKSAHKDKMAAFKMKVQTIGQQVIDTLKTSEKLFSQNISHQVNENFSVATCVCLCV
jgi:outer membrane murein-binding lipoprotein Lpp